MKDQPTIRRRGFWGVAVSEPAAGRSVLLLRLIIWAAELVSSRGRSVTGLRTALTHTLTHRIKITICNGTLMSSYCHFKRNSKPISSQHLAGKVKTLQWSLLQSNHTDCTQLILWRNIHATFPAARLFTKPHSFERPRTSELAAVTESPDLHKSSDMKSSRSRPVFKLVRATERPQKVWFSISLIFDVLW